MTIPLPVIRCAQNSDLSACAAVIRRSRLHRFIRHHVCRGEWGRKRRPVLINSWEAAYFDFTGEDIVRFAEGAAKPGVTAMAGTFGYELDPGKLSEEEKERVRLQIQDFKRYYDLIQDGLYWRLSDPMKNTEYAAWEFSPEDGGEALLNVVMLCAHCNPAAEYVRLRGLDPDAEYFIEETRSSGRDGRQSGMILPPEDGRYLGSALMYCGLPVPRMPGEYQAWQVYLRRV